jgi:hypothetical protein
LKKTISHAQPSISMASTNPPETITWDPATFMASSIECGACSTSHWGLLGVAGLLLVRRDPRNGRPMSVLLQRRGAGADNDGTWAIPGGAIDRGETARAGAARGTRGGRAAGGGRCGGVPRLRA